MVVWCTRSRSVAQYLRIIAFLNINNQRRISSSTSSPLCSGFLFRKTFTNSPPFLQDHSAAFFGNRCFKTTNAEKRADDSDNRIFDYLGGNVAYTTDLTFIPEAPEKKVQCYRILDDDGCPILSSRLPLLSKEIAVKMYNNMVTLQVMDNIFYEVQRQGRIAFYVASTGEEAINIAPAAALTSDDVILPQYREPGVLLWRGFTLQDFANQLFANKSDYGKGRQMHAHYGSKKLNCVTMSAPLTTQLPQAVGAAYSLKMENKNACVVTMCGDGGTSEGDFHAGLNFAAVMDVPIIFICRNNGWAISTPSTEQFRSDCIAVKGQGYGIRSTQVDGNDALAVYDTIRAAREMAITEQRPVLVEALTYRVGHHSTSDDSSKYRQADEIEYWKKLRNPITKFRKWVERMGWWNDKDEDDLQNYVRKQTIEAIQVAERADKPLISELFTDVYDELPSNLHEQEIFVRDMVKRHPKDYPTDVPV